MIRIVLSLFSLLFSIVLVLNGIGLFGTLVGLRATLEGFSVLQTSMIMSAYFVGFILGSYLCPPIIQRVGHIRTFAAFATLCSAAVIAYPLFVTPVVWAFLRIIIGACMAGLYMVIESWLNTLAPKEQRGRVFAIYMAITLLAMASGQQLIHWGKVADFELFAIISILISLALLPVVLTRVNQPTTVATPSLGISWLWKTSPLSFAGACCAGLVSGAFWGMGPIFAVYHQLNASEVAAFMSMTILGGALLQWPIGYLSDRYDRRNIIVYTALLAAVCAVLLVPLLMFSQTTFFAISFFFGGFVFTLYALSVAHTHDHLAPVKILEASRGLLMLYGVGAALGPLVSGLFMQWLPQYGLPLFFTLALVLLVLFGRYRMRETEALSPEEQSGFVPMTRTSTVVLEMTPINHAPRLSDEAETPDVNARNP